MKLRWVIAALMLLWAMPAFSQETFVVGAFSKETPGGMFSDGWEPLVFEKIPRQTDYTLVADGKEVVIHALSNNSASGLAKRVDIDPRAFPIIEFRWKVKNVYQKGDVTKKAGDDYPARVYVSFAYDPKKVPFHKRLAYKTAKAIHGEYPPMAVLNYIWASKAPMGTVIPNAFVDTAMLVVLQSGTERAGVWVTERRNILEDYRKAFGGEPSRISGIAIMSDSDNTGETAEAWYGDIVLRSP